MNLAAALTSVDFWESVLATGLRVALPLALAAIGELIGERAGVLNLGVEGTMAIGAFAGVVGAGAAGVNAGMLSGIVAGALCGALFAVLVVRLGVNEIVCGFGFALGGLALASFLYRGLYETRPAFSPYRSVAVPGLSDIPVLGEVLFDQPLVIWLLPVAVVAATVLLNRTRPGLGLRAVGDAPDAARAKGVDVERVRAAALVGAGALAGLGGAVLSAGLVGEFSDEIVGGRGFVALALVIAAGWRPWTLGVLCVAVGTLQGFQLRAQALDLDVPVELFQALPFLVTLVVLALGVGSRRAPRALGRLAVAE